MQINATVHTVAPVKVPTKIEQDGETFIADVHMLDVELVTEKPSQRNPMFYAPMDHADMFKPGARVTITIAPDDSENAK